MLLLFLLERTVFTAVSHRIAPWRRRRQLLRCLTTYAQGKLRTGYNAGALGKRQLLALLRQELGLEILEVEGHGRGRADLIQVNCDHTNRLAAGNEDRSVVNVYYSLRQDLSRRERRQTLRSLRLIFAKGVSL